MTSVLADEILYVPVFGNYDLTAFLHLMVFVLNLFQQVSKLGRNVRDYEQLVTMCGEASKMRDYHHDRTDRAQSQHLRRQPC